MSEVPVPSPDISKSPSGPLPVDPRKQLTDAQNIFSNVLLPEAERLQSLRVERIIDTALDLAKKARAASADEAFKTDASKLIAEIRLHRYQGKTTEELMEMMRRDIASPNPEFQSEAKVIARILKIDVPVATLKPSLTEPPTPEADTQRFKELKEREDRLIEEVIKDGECMLHTWTAYAGPPGMQFINHNGYTVYQYDLPQYWHGDARGFFDKSLFDYYDFFKPFKQNKIHELVVFAQLLQEDPAFIRKLMFEMIPTRYPKGFIQGVLEKWGTPPYDGWEEENQPKMYVVNALSNEEDRQNLGKLQFDPGKVIAFNTKVVDGTRFGIVEPQRPAA